MDESLIVLGMALVTYATRYAGIAALGWRRSLSGRAEHPSLLRRWLRYVPPAVLAALIVPAILAPERQVELGIPLWVAIGGALVAWRTRSALWTIVGGMVVFWILRGLGLG